MELLGAQMVVGKQDMVTKELLGAQTLVGGLKAAHSYTRADIVKWRRSS